jgi:SAM-dependent methyltransferase
LFIDAEIFYKLSAVSNLKNLNHWYDGIFYKTFIDPFQAKLFERIKNIIPENCSVLDVACGTGELASVIASKVKDITGIDLSERNIKIAKDRNLQNADFIHGDATKLDELIDAKYDYATISLALHEMPPEIRPKVIKQMKNVAEYIIFADYVVPMKKDITGIGVRLVEFFAGKHHFAGYKHFQKNGGLETLIKESDLKIVESYYSHNNTIVIHKTRKTDEQN